MRFVRTLSTTARRLQLAVPTGLDPAERDIFVKLNTSLKPTTLEVQDVSGGCGSMYAITVESQQFKGLTMIKQHRMVNEVLKDDIAKWHGLQLKTVASKE